MNYIVGERDCDVSRRIYGATVVDYLEVSVADRHDVLDPRELVLSDGGAVSLGIKPFELLDNLI